MCAVSMQEAVHGKGRTRGGANRMDAATSWQKNAIPFDNAVAQQQHLPCTEYNNVIASEAPHTLCYAVDESLRSCARAGSTSLTFFLAWCTKITLVAQQNEVLVVKVLHMMMLGTRSRAQ